jgi:hypothetical protein
MLLHTRPGGREAGRIELCGAETLVVGRQPRLREGERAARTDGPGGRASRRHGGFVLDSAGVVRNVDMRSRHGSLLVPAKGPPRRIPPRRPVAVWPGDAVAVGGALGDQPAHLRRMHTFVVLAHGAGAAGEDAAADEDDPLLAALACGVCHDTMLAPRVLPCGHTTCDDCITRWFRDKTTCPACRAACEPATVASGGAPCAQLEAVVRALDNPRVRERVRERDGWGVL